MGDKPITERDGSPDEAVEIEGVAVRRAAIEAAVADLSLSVDAPVTVEAFESALAVLFSASYLDLQRLPLSGLWLRRGQTTKLGSEAEMGKQDEMRVVVTPEMVDAGAAVLAELEGEVTKSMQALEVFLAMSRVRPKERPHEGSQHPHYMGVA